LLPELLRRICWQPPETLRQGDVIAALHAGGARDWQVQLVAECLTAALHAGAAAESNAVDQR
ncbi:MAG: hypothetical protein ACRDRL_09905, partial [Sciscionella sp.]